MGRRPLILYDCLETLLELEPSNLSFYSSIVFSNFRDASTIISLLGCVFLSSFKKPISTSRTQTNFSIQVVLNLMLKVNCFKYISKNWVRDFGSPGILFKLSEEIFEIMQFLSTLKIYSACYAKDEI